MRNTSFSRGLMHFAVAMLVLVLFGGLVHYLFAVAPIVGVLLLLAGLGFLVSSLWSIKGGGSDLGGSDLDN